MMRRVQLVTEELQRTKLEIDTMNQRFTETRVDVGRLETGLATEGTMNAEQQRAQFAEQLTL